MRQGKTIDDFVIADNIRVINDCAFPQLPRAITHLTGYRNSVHLNFQAAIGDRLTADSRQDAPGLTNFLDAITDFAERHRKPYGKSLQAQNAEIYRRDRAIGTRSVRLKADYPRHLRSLLRKPKPAISNNSSVLWRFDFADAILTGHFNEAREAFMQVTRRRISKAISKPKRIYGRIGTARRTTCKRCTGCCKQNATTL